MKSNILLLIGLLLIGAIHPGLAQTADSSAQNNPTAVILHYIDAINMEDYTVAYAMVESPQQTYDEFVAGFAETVRIIPYFGRGGAAAGSLYITTIMLGYQIDGTVKSYYGFFQLANGQNYAPPDDRWHLLRGSFELVKSGTALPNSTIDTLVNSPWNPTLTLSPEAASSGEMNTPAATTILTYFDAINQRDYAAAYAQWFSPAAQALPADYRLPYTQFVNGYQDTAYVMVYTGQIQSIPSSQQRSYLIAYIPVVLVAQQSDATFTAYGGCYALGNLSVGQQGIVNGRFRPLTESLPNAETLFNALNTLECATLGMSI